MAICRGALPTLCWEQGEAEGWRSPPEQMCVHLPAPSSGEKDDFFLFFLNHSPLHGVIQESLARYP